MGDPRGGAGRVWELSERSWMSRVTHRRSGTSQGNLG